MNQRTNAQRTPTGACLRIAAKQLGVVSRDQARATGLSADSVYRLVKRGHWRVVFPSVYGMAGSPYTWEQTLIAACLWAGKESAVSGRAAAAVWRLEGFDPGVVEITTTRNINAPGVIVHRVREWGAADFTYVGKIRVTNPTRTLSDLAAVAGPARAEAALEDALRRGLTSIAKLCWLLGRSGRGHRGNRLLRRLVEVRTPGYAPTGSALEGRFLELLKLAGLPEPTPQYVVRDGNRFIARVDFAFPQIRLAIEVDGYRHHSGREAWSRDVTRQNRLVSRGWRVLRVTSIDLESRPRDTVDTLRRSLEL